MPYTAYDIQLHKVEEELRQLDHESSLLKSALILPDVKQDKELRSSVDRQLNELRMKREKIVEQSVLWQRIAPIAFKVSNP